MSIYDFKAITIDGEEISLEQYRGKVLVIVNTASKCGFTPQYEGLEKIYEQYKDKDFEILGYPSNQFAGQEPGESNEIKNFCTINYGVSFQLFEKGDVRGENALPLFKYLTEEATFRGFDLNKPNEKKLNDILYKRFPEFLEGDSVKWNFTKFLIGRDGNVVGRYEPTIEPAAMSTDIEKLLAENDISEIDKSEVDVDNKKIYTGKDDEEVLNCEGKPCNFVYNDKND
ncbi:glutathione peroxidase [Clostridium sp. CM028]|nr:glutathione peroxidase [Clostridium sp. CF011]MBW9149101.1 glutathione peroxidase [Clostridium sp. CM028]WLC62634.1 glutathione peroxidase [Clostridium sp. CM028]